jgi:VWFA-related protein
MKAAELALFLLTVGSAAASASADTPKTGASARFPAEVALVTVDALVLDDEGQPVHGLGTGDFLVTENGQPQKLATFEAVVAGALPSAVKQPPAISTNLLQTKDLGRTFVIVFDSVHLTPDSALRAKEACAHFLTHDIREGDTVGLLSTAGGIWWNSDGVRGRERLLAHLKDFRGERLDQMPSGVHISDYEAARIVEDHDALVTSFVWKRLTQSGAVLDYDKMSPPGTGGANATANTVPDAHAYHPEVEAYARAFYDAMQKRRRAALETLRQVLESLTTRAGRKSVLLVSEGFVAGGVTPGFREVIDASRRANTAVYFLDARGLVAAAGDLGADIGQMPGGSLRETVHVAESVGNSLLDLEAASAGAERIADETGGFSVKRTNDLASAFDRIGRESEAYYLLGYYPSDERRDGSYRKVGVSVSHRGAQVRARKGYYAPAPSGERRGRAAEQGAIPSLIQRAVDAPFALEAVPLRISAYVLGNAGPSQADVVIATDIDVRGLAFEERGSRYEDRLTVVSVALNLQSGEQFKSSKKIAMNLSKATREGYGRTWYPTLSDFRLPTGPYQVKVVVVDENNERVGTVLHEFEVPDLSGWRVSTPVLSDTLPPSGSGRLPVPLARRTFAPQSRLFCWFSVHGAARDEHTRLPEVFAGFSLQDASGREVSGGDPAVIRPDGNGGLARVIGISLEGLPPGEYSLLLTFEDKIAGKSYEYREPLIIEATSS